VTRQSLLLLPKKHLRLLSQLRSEDLDDDLEGLELYDTELTLHRSFARPQLVVADDDEDAEISDYVQLRLFLARELALRAYRRQYEAA
jgi:hypothetical protein